MKVHQNIVIDGKDLGDKGSRKESKFCNEGKWDNFIDPLLPDSKESTFLELGTNAGLFLKMATEKGFDRVIGYDKSKSTTDVGKVYRDKLGMDYKIVNETVDENFDWNKFPVIDVTLMANFHYHLLMNDFVHIVDRLEHKTCYCLVVTAKRKDVHWLPGTELNDLKVYFKNWKVVGTVNHVDPEGDPHPRPLMSILFESELKRRETKDLWNPKNKGSGQRVPREFTAKLCRQVLENESIEDLRGLVYYKKIRKARDKDWDRAKIDKFVQGKVDLMYDIKKNGFRNPILIRSDNRLLEGGHRMILAEEMGYSSMITRVV